MTIKRENLDKIDFSDVVEPGSGLIELTTPGELLAEMLEEYGLSQNALALELHVPANRIAAIVKGTRSITADTAIRLGRYFGMSAEFWMNLQKDYELRKVRREQEDKIKNEVRPRAA